MFISWQVGQQMIHIHPFSADQDIPDYDLDSEDEEWLQEHTRKGELLPLDPLQFEEMMDRLEKASGLKAVTLQEAKLLLKDDDDLITAVYDYWLNKRLRLQHPLIPQVLHNLFLVIVILICMKLVMFSFAKVEVGVYLIIVW